MFCEIIKFSQPNVAMLKKSILGRYSTVRSSHVDEALASSFGFRTYASMLTTLRQMTGSTRLMVQMDTALLQLRLEQLGYAGLDVPTLRRAVIETVYPDPWLGDELEQTLVRRRLPEAANSGA
ncbi:hypothetical protein Rleg4DRAFT_1860 [Rhizobium leguminosarum bv. trifolii WSM2297]|uniref:Uncharacterized protein n=1 Tax=Rhizobium leguminosarum bv. trifolii WSM2297 TaxID=754762 RepID=J0CL52_RHILT|nr:hypothetical protein Rleg4DRAFT_1860 [Rhizobium leguminosarum bv. trifolii WSM2297]